MYAVQPLQRAPVDPQRRLERRRPDQVDARPAPLLGDGRRKPEPVGRPARAEPLPRLGRPVVERGGVGERDAVDRPRNQQLVRLARVRVDPFAQALRRLRQAGAGVLRVADQRRLDELQLRGDERREETP